ncbi:DUF3772 domain-containing protein [soil metagenome]
MTAVRNSDVNRLMRAAARIALVALFTLAPLAGGNAFAQDTQSIDSKLDDARTRLEALNKALESATTDAQLIALRDTALGLQGEADAIGSQLDPQLTGVTARLTELGPAPTAPAKEAPDIAQQRATLGKASASLDAQVKLARLLAVESQQAADRTVGLRRSQFEAQLGERTPSILSSRFWHELADSFPSDSARAKALFADFRSAARATSIGVWTGLLLGAVAVLVAQRYAVLALIRRMATHVPAGRLRRSLAALGLALIAAIGPALAAQLIRLGFTFSGQPTDAVQSLLVTFVGAVAFGAYLTGLGRALLAPNRANWRLTRMADPVVQRVRHYPVLLAIVTALGWLLDRVSTVANMSLASTVALNCLSALLTSIALAWISQSVENARHHLAPEVLARSARPMWLAVLTWSGRLFLLASFVCLLFGYVAFGAFIVKQLIWIGVVAATAWLLAAVIDDAFSSWFSTPNASDPTALPVGLHAQLGVLFSGALRVTIVLLAIVMIGAPLGQGPGELIQRGAQLRDGIMIGEIAIKPGSVMQALIVLTLGLFGVRVLQRWLSDDYLPTTGLDAGMRASTTTLLGYVGTVIAIALAMSAIGIGLERIAWVASALSVGIGFGLQAIVQNFVAGLILLAERPVRVGDWVSLSGVEGDIRRINVRATEIALGDRSTVIMPNSEFITKAVRNITHGQALGLVQLRLPLPIAVDVEAVRTILFEAFKANDAILDDPAPVVFLDGLSESTPRIIFNASASVASPRDAYAARSAVLFDVMKRLREANVSL